jgi:hypothetical protein
MREPFPSFARTDVYKPLLPEPRPGQRFGCRPPQLSIESALMTASRSLLPLVVIDWHDGIVLGVVRRTQPGAACLAGLLAYNPDSNCRILALLELAPEELAESEGWALQALDDARRAARELMMRRPRNVSVVRTESASGLITAEASTSIESILDDIPCDIEAAVAPERGRWFLLVP